MFHLEHVIQSSGLWLIHEKPSKQTQLLDCFAESERSLADLETNLDSVPGRPSKAQLWMFVTCSLEASFIGGEIAQFDMVLLLCCIISTLSASLEYVNSL